MIKKRNMKLKLLMFSLLSAFMVNGQGVSKKVLFLGNSYTSVNNLPKMVADIANSMGDVLIFDANTPGGQTLKQHSTNVTSLTKIEVGNWDYVVLQEQSQYPSFPNQQVANEVFPYARFLDSIINVENPCAETVFYMTWGRKNGDASNCPGWPPVCTYVGMDSLLNLRYRQMATNNNGIISPVGAVWRYIRQNHPSIELYQSDESHPSLAGTYAAACAFYSIIYRKDPSLITFDSGLSAVDAANIRAAAKLITYNNLLEWHVGEYDPIANFTFSNTGAGQVSFTNSSTNATDFVWSFGDGTTSNEGSPTHTYVSNGTYNVMLVVDKCGVKDTVVKTITVTALGIESQKKNPSFVRIYPNPSQGNIHLKVTDELIGSDYVIYDNTGKVLLTGVVDSEETKVDLNSLLNGFYHIRVGSNWVWKISLFKN